MAFAIIKTGGKQYKVAVGEKLKIETITPEDDGSVIFKEVLLTADGEKIIVGTPFVKGATVTGKLIKQGRARKLSYSNTTQRPATKKRKATASSSRR